MLPAHRLAGIPSRQRSLRVLNQFLKYSRGKDVNRAFWRRCLSSSFKAHDLNTDNLICDGVIRSPFPDIVPVHTTIDQLVWSNLDRWPDHIAIECSTTDKKYSFRQLRVLSGRFAASLRKQGFRPGDVLSVVLPNVPDYPVIVLGAIEAGVIVSPVNPTYTPYELSHLLGDSNSVAVLTSPELASKVEDAKLDVESKTKKAFPLRLIVVKSRSSESLPPNAINYFDMISGDDNEYAFVKSRRQPDDVAVLPYSSGTTGLPKGVELTHRNVVSNMLQSNDPRIGFLFPTTSTHQDVLPAILPFFHIYGLVIILLRALFNGTKIVSVAKFEAEPFLSLLKDFRATVLYAVPPMITLLGNHSLVTPEHFATLKCVCNGAGPVASGDLDKLISKAKYNANFAFIQGYGMTESSPLTLITPFWKEDFACYVPVKSTHVKIIKEDGTVAAPSERGEICIKGPQVMRGYHKKPEATKETIDENGYLHTGDGGYYEVDGSIRIVERIKELIKVQSFQVAPAELEGILRSHPHVSDAAVIGVPDTRTGEKPLAFVVKQGEASEKDLQQYVADKVSSYKKLCGVVFVDSIPKNPSGKILRRIIKDEYFKSKQ